MDGRNCGLYNWLHERLRFGHGFYRSSICIWTIYMTIPVTSPLPLRPRFHSARFHLSSQIEFDVVLTRRIVGWVNRVLRKLCFRRQSDPTGTRGLTALSVNIGSLGVVMRSVHQISAGVLAEGEWGIK